MARTVVNLLGFQAGWFACVLSAAAGRPWIGIAVVAALAALHLVLQRHRSGELLLVAFAATYGYSMDSFVVLAGAIEFPEQAQLGRPSPFWMVAMWVNLALTLNVCMAWLRGRTLLAAALGAIGGPLSYYAGARLGAITLSGGTLTSLAAIGVEWLVAMPVLVWVARLTHRDDLSRLPQTRGKLLTAEGES